MYSDKIVFGRLLTLLEPLWENFDVCFDQTFDFAEFIQLDDETLLNILSRMGDNYLNKEEENIVGEFFFFKKGERDFFPLKRLTLFFKKNR